MADINDEMKAIAEYAIKSARERYRLELDYSEQSIADLDKILEKLYWGFSGHPKEDDEGGIIFNTAVIWGAYLGEYMRRKWGGNWVRKDTRQVLMVRDVEFAPISFIFHMITGRINYKVGDYLFEANGKIPAVATIPAKEKTIVTEQRTIKRPTEHKPTKKKLALDRDLVLAISGITGIVVILIIFIVGFIKIRQNGLAALSLIPVNSGTDTYTPAPSSTATNFIPPSPTPSMTLMPSYTPIPTNTLRPTRTSLPTDTATAVPTSTETPTPTETEIPYRSPTPTRTPTKTNVPPTQPPTATKVPPPTATQPPPIVIESCEVNPSTIQAGIVTILDFSATFSAPGYSFSTEMSEEYPGASVCNAKDTDGDGTASCDASSGLVPSSTTVHVTFSSSVGTCVASFGTP